MTYIGRLKEPITMLKRIKFYWILLLLIIVSSCKEVKPKEDQVPKLKALIIDGQNNHYVWPKTTMILRDYLKETELFDVDIYRTDTVWLGIKYNKDRPGTLEKYIDEFPLDTVSRVKSVDSLEYVHFDVDFEKYDLIVSNLGAFTAEWPEVSKRKFEKYMNNGGGLVVVHAANNAWGEWDEFNKMIGLGAWGGRDSLSGPYVYYDQKDELQYNYSQGIGGSHGAQYEFLITTREPEHPIMKGLPSHWLHAQDELYDRMRGPFENATILATAHSEVDKNEQTWEPVLKGTGWHVPMLMAIEYGKGKTFHTAMGHFDYSVECVGFMTTFQRGAEWAATGKVTQVIPKDFPSDKKSASRTWKEVK